MGIFTGKTLMVTGGTGSFGHAVVNRFLETDIGEMDISLQDTYRSLNKIGGGRVIVTDMAGNRYEITDLDALDRKSRRKLDLYL